MKKILLCLLIIFCLSSCVFNETTDEIITTKKYSLTYENCGYGDPIEIIKDIDKIPLELPFLFEDGYKFLGWYLDGEYQEKAKVNEILTTDVTLYAKWEQLEYSEGFEFILSSTGDSYILVYYNDTGVKDLVIPPTYNDLPVKHIGEGAIIYNDTIESVMIPSSITKIDAYVFSNCKNLKYLSIGKGLKEIDKYALCNVPALETIIVDQKNSYLDSRNNCNAIIYSEENTLIKGCKTTIIPNDIISIGMFAFYGCSEIKEIILPDSVFSIGDYAFHSCYNLNTLIIGSNLNKIESFAFVNCNSLNTIYNNSNLFFVIGSNDYRKIASNAKEVYNKGEWSYVNGVPTINK